MPGRTCSRERGSWVPRSPPGHAGKVCHAATILGSFHRHMSASFFPHLEILPASQRRLWDQLAGVPPEFVLYGGTAIALHLAHRRSVDFDFFGDRPFDPERLATTIPFVARATVTHQEPNTLTVRLRRGGAVKLSFFGLPRLPRLRPPHLAPDNGLKVASLLDLAGTKAAVIQRRAEAKDYLDIDAILRHGQIDLATALAAAQAIYGTRFNPEITLKALAYFGEATLRRLPRAVKDRLAKAAGAVDLDRLPTIPVPGRARR
jgi:hypothetical protein